MLRAAWLAQELLSTFDGELGEVALVPPARGVPHPGGRGAGVGSGGRRGLPEAKEIGSGCGTSSPRSGIRPRDRKPANRMRREDEEKREASASLLR